MKDLNQIRLIITPFIDGIEFTVSTWPRFLVAPQTQQSAYNAPASVYSYRFAPR